MSHDHHQHTTHENDPADAWHTHTVSEKPQHAHAENIAHGTVLVFGVGGFLIIAFTVIAMIVYFDWYKTGLMADRVENIPVSADADKVRATGELKDYAWVDGPKGVVQLRLEDARKKVEQEYARANR